ncbi:MAG: hypothetical protein JST12_04000 [Armatimonadetes bacterium]|nr:hypothetical protein [Armatimonadota bacterium]
MMTTIWLALLLHRQSESALYQNFQTPPDSARPWVYWYFMEGNMTREGMTADLEAMKKVGIGGGIFLEVNIGIPRGPVQYMSPEWKSMVGYAIDEADRLGMQISLGTGPGWCGTGGPWVTPDHAMQHLVSSETQVQGPTTFEGVLPKPKPRNPFFGVNTLEGDLREEWQNYYRDEVVLAIPAVNEDNPISGLDEKSLVYRAPFSSTPGVKPYIFPSDQQVPLDAIVDSQKVLDISDKMESDGTLRWQVPAGKWTILRFGRTLTGQTTRPAPQAGLGFETDKFETAGIDDHLKTYVDSIVAAAGPNHEPGRGLVGLHFDSWEMGSQNWSPHFRELFKQHRGYDPVPFLPVMAGKIVDNIDASERFLWDLRQTAQELVEQNHMGTIKQKARQYGLSLTVEPYDMNPTADLELGATADIPSGEFWSKGYGYPCEYSCIEASSVAHTNGKPVVAAESFTSDDRDAWLQHPASMKEQGDWALAAGINKFVFHRYEHQPKLDELPGMTMGPYGVHWERTETWWDLSAPYHRYIARCQELLRQGLPVADVLYLLPEGAPNVFQAPPSALLGEMGDRRGYNFDACAPSVLLNRARAKDGRIVLPNGMSYRLLVLPRVKTMTPALMQKVKELKDQGVTIIGNAPDRSPSLTDFPQCDNQVRTLAASAWGGKNAIVKDPIPQQSSSTLEGAKWIWADEGDPAKEAPVASKVFRRSFAIPRGKRVQSATLSVTGDNEILVRINGMHVASGTDFNRVQVSDVADKILRGQNQIQIDAKNVGTGSNPAGVIANLVITFTDGTTQTVRTDDTWTVLPSPHKPKVLGDWNMSPWNLSSASFPFNPMYPSYDFTSSILHKKLGVVPDIESGDALRYCHRKIGSVDAYFIANRSAKLYHGNVSFRITKGSPQWWDPMTGERRALPTFRRSGQTTTVPVSLDGLQSGFVVFTPGPAPQAAKANFPTYTPISTLTGNWEVQFDPTFGGPKKSIETSLIDWSHSTDDSVKYYSGKAIYRKQFDAPTSWQKATAISLGEVKNIAGVRLNGRDLGVAWCTPWRLSIPSGVLKSKGNVLEITVANLWVNRLIGDTRLPADQRITHTTWNPYQPSSTLQPSGLLGPVKFLR